MAGRTSKGDRDPCVRAGDRDDAAPFFFYVQS